MEITAGDLLVLWQAEHLLDEAYGNATVSWQEYQQAVEVRGALQQLNCRLAAEFKPIKVEVAP